MTKEQSEKHFKRKTTWTTVAIDFETATVMGKEVYRDKWKQKTTMREIEEITELLTVQAADVMCVDLAKVEGYDAR